MIEVDNNTKRKNIFGKQKLELSPLWTRGSMPQPRTTSNIHILDTLDIIMYVTAFWTSNKREIK